MKHAEPGSKDPFERKDFLHSKKSSVRACVSISVLIRNIRDLQEIKNDSRCRLKNCVL